MNEEIFKRIMLVDKFSLYLKYIIFLTAFLSLFHLYAAIACVACMHVFMARIAHMERKVLKQDDYFATNYKPLHDKNDTGSGTPDDPVAIVLVFLVTIVLTSHFLMIRMHVNEYLIINKLAVIFFSLFSGAAFMNFSIWMTALNIFFKKI